MLTFFWYYRCFFILVKRGGEWRIGTGGWLPNTSLFLVIPLQMAITVNTIQHDTTIQAHHVLVAACTRLIGSGLQAFTGTGTSDVKGILGLCCCRHFGSHESSWNIWIHLIYLLIQYLIRIGTYAVHILKCAPLRKMDIYGFAIECTTCIQPNIDYQSWYLRYQHFLW